MKTAIIFLLFILILTAEKTFAVSEQCESALNELFASEVTDKEAADFLSLQGQITLHRMAWSYLRTQQNDQNEKVESVEQTIIGLLNEKYTNTNPEFIKAREAFEAQPLSRTALAEIAPYLKEVLSADYGERDERFKLNLSDIKLLAAIARQEKASAVNGKFDHRMLNSKSPLGMLNFTKLINSSYKLSQTPEEKNLNIEAQLEGLEQIMTNMEEKLSGFFSGIAVPPNCFGEGECLPDQNLAQFFKQNEDVQKIFWESLAEKLESDDVLLERLSYGDLWLQVKAEVKSGTRIESPSASSTQEPATGTRRRSFSPNVPRRNPAMRRPAPPAVRSSTGVIIDDPIGIIINDKRGRQRKNFQGMEEAYLMAMAEAVLSNDKVFMYQGKLFNRSSGRQVTPEAALSSLPPQRRAQYLAILARTRPELKIAQAAAMANGDTTFVAENNIYNLSGARLNPAAAIASAVGRKLGLTVSPARYQGMGQDYLVARAHALSNNQPFFTLKGQSYDSYSGRTLASPFRSPADSDAKIDRNRRRMYENLSDGELIRNFHRDNPNPNCGHYGIIDKKNATIKIFANGGQEVYSSVVLVGREASDQRTRWVDYQSRRTNAATGAGIFTVRPQNMNDSFNRRMFNNNIISFKDESNSDTVFAIHQVPVGLEAERGPLLREEDPSRRRISAGCVNMGLAQLNAVRQWIKPQCKVYVLPEEPGNKFIIRNNELNLVSSTPVPLSRQPFYNFSPQSESAPRPIEVRITNQAGNTTFSRSFVDTLEREKSKLMEAYNLSNEEYNDLAMLAYGIMGNESQFGRSPKLWVKESAQPGVMMLKLLFEAKDLATGNDADFLDAVNTSRGFTQVKNLPQSIRSAYPHINKDNLMVPGHSAIATVGFLAEAAKTMRRIAVLNNSDQENQRLKITRENMMDYMGYLYQGGSGKLRTADVSRQATPEWNEYFQALQRHMSYIEVSQR